MMKVAPVMRALIATDAVECRLVHTGQHYDAVMRDGLIRELGLPTPDAMLEIGSGSPVGQIGRLLLELEPVFRGLAPDLIVVVGDVNSTLGAALAAAAMRIPIAHVEAGLRSFDRTMPEEINRIVTDQLSDLLFATEDAAVNNLRREGIAAERIHLVGNVMADALLTILPHAPSPDRIAALAQGDARWWDRVVREGYAFVTLHRPSNVDDAITLRERLDMLAGAAERLPLVFAIHPRTRKAIEKHGAADRLAHPGILSTDPLPYADTIGLIRGARLVLTDSGGIQEETTVLGVPCLTVRDNTERPVTVELGTNRVVGIGTERVLAAVDGTLSGKEKRGRAPPLWDGHAAERIAVELLRWLEREPHGVGGDRSFRHA